MKQTAAPDLQPVAFATNGTKDAITATTDTGSNNASYDVGFPDITMLLKSAGGLPPKGGNFNQILYELSSAAQYLSSGAGYAYDSTFSTGISGYPLGSVVRSSDMSGFWLNLTDENTVNPENSDGTATGWIPIPICGTTAITGLTSTGVTLTALQAAKPVITLAGVLTANIQIILPPWIYQWDITNNCTGSYTVTAKTTSGTGVTIPASTSVKVVGDGTNINYETTTRFLPGTPTATTPALGNSSTRLATTAFVQESNTGLVGSTRNAKMSVPTTGATATFTADEVVVADSLTGNLYRVASFSSTINLGNTGANGMDTGTVPASGYVALYVIYNPTSGASALLAVDATSASAPEVYGGSNLPTGYTASALVSVWRTSSSLFVIGFQRERHVSILTTVVYSTSTAVTSYNAFSISASIPMNARTADMQILCSQTTPNSAIELNIAQSPTGIGQCTANASAFSSGTSGSPTTTSSAYVSASLDIIDSQALYYKMSTSTAATYAISCRGYTI